MLLRPAYFVTYLLEASKSDFFFQRFSMFWFSWTCESNAVLYFKCTFLSRCDQQFDNQVSSNNNTLPIISCQCESIFFRITFWRNTHGYFMSTFLYVICSTCCSQRNPFSALSASGLSLRCATLCPLNIAGKYRCLIRVHGGPLNFHR